MSETPRLRTAIVLFTRDLRVHDNPALELAVRSAEYVVPLFVVQDGLRFAVPNRARFLRESLADLRQSLRELGGDLVLRHGDPVEETLRLAAEVEADGLVLASDVSAYARRRWQEQAPDLRFRQIRKPAPASASAAPANPARPTRRRAAAISGTSGRHSSTTRPWWPPPLRFSRRQFRVWT